MPEMLDEAAAIFRLPNREVWIVTASDGRRHGGLVATWVLQASIDPEAPIVAAAIAVNHFTRELIDAGGGFAVHLITPDQMDLAWRFGIGSGRDRDKLSGLEWHPSITGSPILSRSLAWLDCRVYDRHDGGDRIYYWADVVAAKQARSGEPLCERELFAAANEIQWAALRRNMDDDLEYQRPLYQAWRAKQESESPRNEKRDQGGGPA